MIGAGGGGTVVETNSEAIKVAVEIIDNFISGSRGMVTEDNSSAIKTAIELLDNFISGSRGLVTEDNSADIKTAVEIIDNAISGSQMQCDIVASLPAGSNNIGDIDINPVVKTIETELLAITAVAAEVQQKSSVLDVSSIDRASVMIDHARDTAAAFVGAGTEYRVEVSQAASGNDTWRTLYSVVCGIAAASAIVMDAEEPAGETEIPTGAVLPAAGDIIFFKNGTIANSEWAKVWFANDAIDMIYLQDGLTNTQAAITLYNKAEQFVLNIDLKTAVRMRVVVNNNNGSINKAIVSRIACISS